MLRKSYHLNNINPFPHPVLFLDHSLLSLKYYDYVLKSPSIYSYLPFLPFNYLPYYISTAFFIPNILIVIEHPISIISKYSTVSNPTVASLITYPNITKTNAKIGRASCRENEKTTVDE